MQDKEINSIFRKVIYESAEMVFLTEDIYPYNIFFANKSFEKHIGAELADRSLVGLGLDIKAYILKREVTFILHKKEYTFKLESPRDNGSAYVLFYEGRETGNGRSQVKAYDDKISALDRDVAEIDRLAYAGGDLPNGLPLLGHKQNELVSIHEVGARPDQIPLPNFAIWKVNLERKELIFEPATEKFISELSGPGYRLDTFRDMLVRRLGTSVSGNHQRQDAVSGALQIPNGKTIYFSSFFSGESKSELLGVIWADTHPVFHSEWAMYRDFWMNSPEAMVIVKPDGEVLIANNELKALLGIDRLERISDLDDLSVYPDERASWSEWLSSSIGDQTGSRFSTFLTRKGHGPLNLEVTSRKSLINQIEYILLSFREISKSVRPEQKTRDDGDYLLNLVEQVPGGVYELVMNPEGRLKFSFLSKGIQSILGFSEEEGPQFIYLSTLIQRVHPEDLPHVVVTSVTSARTKEIWQCQFRVRSGSDSQQYRWVMSAARPQALENGEMMWSGYLTDISMHNEFEAKLEEARLAAEKANQVKSEFLSMISHELRTPLNAISGSVYSLFLEDPSEIQKSALDTINFAVDNLLIMINDLLDFQKIEAGKLTIEYRSLQLKDLMEQVLKGLSFHAKDTNNKLELHLSDGLDILVKADRTRLSQVMNNLITNALKFTDQGRVDVRVENVGQTKSKVRVNFSVTDTGIGIAPEHKQKIFDQFDQVKPTFHSKYGGTGLGLSITKKLLTLMGGTIAMESEVGKGSRFFFELEFDRVQDMQVDSESSPSQTDSSEHLHLLMAEDNEVNSLVLGKIIKKWGFTHHRVVNGKEAVEAARIGKYDCILMDIQMPVMDGFDAALEIKKFSGTPIIALTAAAKLEILERIDECDFDGFVAKPIDAAELLKQIRAVVEGKI